MRTRGELTVDLPPNFFPFIKPVNPDWHVQYSLYNKPGEYYSGGTWPFICGLYVAALVAAKRYKLAEKMLVAFTQSIKISNTGSVEFGFKEWLRAQDGKAMGKDWQHAEEFEKAKYNQGQSSKFRGQRYSGAQSERDFSDFFESMFGGTASAGRSRQVKYRGEDYIAELHLELIDAYKTHKQTLSVNGKNIRITIPAGIENGQTIKIAGHGELLVSIPQSLLFLLEYEEPIDDLTEARYYSQRTIHIVERETYTHFASEVRKMREKWGE